MSDYCQIDDPKEILDSYAEPSGYWRPHVLSSYGDTADASMDVTIHYRRAFGLLMFDSGAFTAYRQGTPIALSDYLSFLEERASLYDQYVALDVIGDPEATLVNYRLMREAGFQPLPVYQMGAPKSHFGIYAESSPIVGLGGLVGRQIAPGDRIKYLAEMKRVADGYGVDVHWFGVSKPYWALQRYQPAQLDNSVYLQSLATTSYLSWDGSALLFTNLRSVRGERNRYRTRGVIKRAARWVGIPRSKVTWDAAFLRDNNSRMAAAFAYHVERETGVRYVLGAGRRWHALRVAAAAYQLQREGVIGD